MPVESLARQNMRTSVPIDATAMPSVETGSSRCVQHTAGVPKLTNGYASHDVGSRLTSGQPQSEPLAIVMRCSFDSGTLAGHPMPQADCAACRGVVYRRRPVRYWTVWDHYGIMDVLLWHDHWGIL